MIRLYIARAQSVVKCLFFLGEFVLFQLSPNFPGTNNFAIYIIQLLIPNITAPTAIYFHIALIAINFQIALLCYWISIQHCKNISLKCIWRISTFEQYYQTKSFRWSKQIVMGWGHYIKYILNMILCYLSQLKLFGLI